MSEAEHRLVAILAADVAGYSRLMAADDQATVAALDGAREVFRNAIESEGGRVVDTAGDSVLAVFTTATGAVRAAVNAQQKINKTAETMPEDRRMLFRIGVTLGEVIEKADGTVYGDGVNIAARLEAASEPGGITISGMAYDHVHNRVAAAYRDLGTLAVKNIPAPVRAYGVMTDAPATEIELPSKLSDKPSIAVLPFDNLSGDSEQEYFVDGITEDLITALSSMRWLSVTARNSTFSYKGQSPDVRRVGRELGVRYVLEGSVRKGGDRVRISAQLIDAADGNHIWAQRYDRKLVDIFDVQDEITLTLAGAIEPELAQIERDRARRKTPDNLDAWDLWQRGLWHMWQLGQDDLVEAERFFHQAIETNPHFGAAYASLSYCYYFENALADTPREDILSRAEAAAKQAIAIDDKNAAAHFALGRALTANGDYAAAIAELRLALNLNPSFAAAHYGLGLALQFSGQVAESLESLEAARALSPHDPHMWTFESVSAQAHLALGEYDKAVQLGRSAIRRPGVGFWAYASLASALGHLGRVDEARPIIDKLLELKPDFSKQFVDRVFKGVHRSYYHPYCEGLRKARLAGFDQSKMPE